MALSDRIMIGYSLSRTPRSIVSILFAIIISKASIPKRRCASDISPRAPPPSDSFGLMLDSDDRRSCMRAGGTVKNGMSSPCTRAPSHTELAKARRAEVLAFRPLASRAAPHCHFLVLHLPLLLRQACISTRDPQSSHLPCRSRGARPQSTR